jgi:heme-degrading monooxygenase HmoA
VALVALAERRVAPGRAAAYVAAVRALSRELAFIDGRGELRTLADDDDPERVLVVSRWASRADFDQALGRLPAGLIAEVDAHTASRVGSLDWHRIAHEIERMAVRASYLVVRRYTLPPGAWPTFEPWIVARMRDLVELPGVVSQSLLVGVDDPSRVVSLVQYTGPDVVLAADQVADRHSPPPELRDLAAEQIAGRTDLIWEPTQRGVSP